MASWSAQARLSIFHGLPLMLTAPLLPASSTAIHVSTCERQQLSVHKRKHLRYQPKRLADLPSPGGARVRSGTDGAHFSRSQRSSRSIDCTPVFAADCRQILYVRCGKSHQQSLPERNNDSDQPIRRSHRNTQFRHEDDCKTPVARVWLAFPGRMGEARGTPVAFRQAELHAPPEDQANLVEQLAYRQ
jgi:hypothetical protein